MENISGENRLTRQQKTGFVLLLVFGALTVTLGFLQMRNNIYSPFVVRLDKAKADIDSFFNDKTRLQKIDTDHDGLNDYEEMEFYQTSAYLPDTDSDGIPDKTEIEQGTDPLCPEGQECDDATAEAESKDSATIEASLGGLVETPAELLGGVDVDLPEGYASSSIDINAIAQSPVLLRQLLLSSGKITEEQLKTVDDATLLELAQELTSE